MFSGDSAWYKVGPTGLNNSNVGTSYDYWAYNGVLVDKDNAKNDASIDNLVMLLKKTDSTLTNQAKILYADGTIKEVNFVSDDYDDTGDVNFSGLNVGTLYLANETSEGYNFEAISVAGNKNNEIGDYTFVDGSSTDVTLVGGAGDDKDNIKTLGSTPISDDAVVFVFGGGNNTTGINDGKILTGKELKTIDGHASDANKISTTSKGYFTSTVNGLTRASIIAVTMNANTTALPDGDVKGDNYGLIVGNGTVIDSKTISYTVWNGTENINVTEKKTSGGLTGREQFAVITYDAITDGVITGVDKLTTTTAGLWSA